MTVGIAARAADGSIFLASDRMLTSGDIEFEPPSPKLRSLTSSICCTFSGDAAFHAEIVSEVRLYVNAHVQKTPEVWLKVKDVVANYLACRNSAKLRRAENTVLAPIGLDVGRFLSVQKTMDTDLVGQLSRELINFQVPALDVIIAGIDDEGSHIYVVNDDYVSCNDALAFAAIGIGARHAESQLMLARHTWHSSLSDTLMMIYLAKKRAEIAPGVGNHTDLCMLGPRLGQTTTLQPSAIDTLDAAYRKLVCAEQTAQDIAQTDIRSYLDELSTHSASEERTQESLSAEEDRS